MSICIVPLPCIQGKITLLKHLPKPYFLTVSGPSKVCFSKLNRHNVMKDPAALCHCVTSSMQYKPHADIVMGGVLLQSEHTSTERDCQRIKCQFPHVPSQLWNSMVTASLVFRFIRKQWQLGNRAAATKLTLIRAASRLFRKIIDNAVTSKHCTYLLQLARLLVLFSSGKKTFFQFLCWFESFCCTIKGLGRDFCEGTMHCIQFLLKKICLRQFFTII